MVASELVGWEAVVELAEQRSEAVLCSFVWGTLDEPIEFGEDCSIGLNAGLSGGDNRSLGVLYGDVLAAGSFHVSPNDWQKKSVYRAKS